MTFADLGLSDELLKAVETAGYTEPTPIQAQAIPAVLMMKDLVGIAQTGTGKTASFVLPMIDVLASGRRRARMPRSLILEPTRELAAQVAENFDKYGENHDLKMALLIGGVQMGDQVRALDEGVDVLIATPGRLMDLFERGKILLNGCELLVIDEADRMLDMGFIPDIEFICDKLPVPRQTMLFSATMPPPIEKLAKKFLVNPKRIEVARAATANENIQQFKVPVSPRKKKEALRHFLRTDDVRTAIVFSNRKTTVRDLAKTLQKEGYAAGEIHGDIDQNTRNRELQRFKDGDINILVASDVAARGLDVKDVSHVFNYDTPWHPDDYVHRIGRTGRAGAKGRAFTFVTADDAEAIANVEKLTGIPIPTFGKEDILNPVPVRSSPERDHGGPIEEQPKEKPKRSRRKPAAPNEGANSTGSEETPRRDSRSTRDGGADDRSRPTDPSGSRRGRNSRQPDAKAKPQKAVTHLDGDVTDADWNGPVPGFLGVSALN
ncbi:DEAD/DEAH box helicase [Pseudopontixanthobacter vadosimaris]|uniref:DEAD/DEAH box helicase n=1 Tax=Pseudopontixanthobacter vadosimaris TaxID=2726450 RepID=UPI001475895C|nr:DEAD/DEAH box helicase [Pseudopontixanthobacter vadosimaris]